MSLALTVPVTTATAVTLAASDVPGGNWGVVISIAATCTALGVIARQLHLPEIAKGILNFVRTWNGEPARPGVERRPGVAEDLATLKEHIHEIKGRDAQLVVALEQLAIAGRENGLKIDRIDQRVTEHRRRNDKTIDLLQDAIRQQAEDRQIIDAARAILTELGHDGELPVTRVGEATQLRPEEPQ